MLQCLHLYSSQANVQCQAVGCLLPKHHPPSPFFFLKPLFPSCILQTLLLKFYGYSAINYNCWVYWTVELVLNLRNIVWTTLLYILFKKHKKFAHKKITNRIVEIYIFILNFFNELKLWSLRIFCLSTELYTQRKSRVVLLKRFRAVTVLSLDHSSMCQANCCVLRYISNSR